MTRVDRRWFGPNGANVTKFIWGAKRNFWKWIVDADEKVLMLLLPKDSMMKLMDDEQRADHIRRANTYRVKMICKLYHYSKQKEEEKFTKLAKIITIHSKSFRC